MYRLAGGDNNRLAQMFENGEASPFDCTDSGWTLLHYALSAGQLHTARFLKDAGADLNAESLRRETPFNIAWNRILSGYVDAASELTLREVFNDTEQLDAREFTILHKIVLGMVGSNLSEQLELSTEKVNTKDSDGYTPLAWAAARGDHKSVDILFRHGASITVTNNFNQQPIHLAARTGNVETVRVLVSNGADVNVQEPETNMTPLHYAAECQDNAIHVQELADLGACIDGRHHRGWTPLHWTCWRGYRSSMEALLALGVDVAARTNDGNAAVMLATANNSANCLPTLISAGGDCKVVKNDCWNTLHYAAIGGKLDTLRALSKGDLFGIDVDGLRTADTGQTVSDMLAARLSALEHNQTELGEIEAAWMVLLNNVYSRNVPKRRDSSSSSEGTDEREFADAHSDVDEVGPIITM